jgi:hypothetical protein
MLQAVGIHKQAMNAEEGRIAEVQRQQFIHDRLAAGRPTLNGKAATVASI